MPSRRRKTRVRTVDNDVKDFLDAAAQESRLERMSDDALFSLDTAGKRPGKRPRPGVAAKDASKVRVFKLSTETAPLSSTRRVQAAKAKSKAQKREAAAARAAEDAERRRVATAVKDGGRSTFLRTAEAAEPVRDLWEDGVTAPALLGRIGEAAPEAILEYSCGISRPQANPSAPEAARRAPRSVPKGRTVPAVVVPAGGLSYNPSFEDHQDAIGEAVTHERTFVGKRARLQAYWDTDPEYTRTLDVVADYSDGEGDDEDGLTSMSANPPVVVSRKTTAQRNKQARHEAALKAAAKEAHVAELDRAAMAHRALARRARKEAAEAEEKRERRVAAKEVRDAAAEPVFLKKGKAVVERRAVEVPLMAELPGSLRTMRPSSARHPVHERWRSLVLQDKVEVGGRKVGKRKAWKKVVKRGDW